MSASTDMEEASENINSVIEGNSAATKEVAKEQLMAVMEQVNCDQQKMREEYHKSMEGFKN